MFTGIITHVGKFKPSTRNSLVLKTTAGFVSNIKIGDSVAVNGVCLTVEKKQKDQLGFAVMPETLKRTNLGILKEGSRLNLEKSVTVQTFLSGHFVQGHIDGVGKIKGIKKNGNSKEIEVKTDASILGFLVEKGSVSLNGVSLTIAKLNKNSFVVAVIPHTLLKTNLKDLEVGDTINIEVDILAKYIKKFFKK